MPTKGEPSRRTRGGGGCSTRTYELLCFINMHGYVICRHKYMCIYIYIYVCGLGMWVWGLGSSRGHSQHNNNNSKNNNAGILP